MATVVVLTGFPEVAITPWAYASSVIATAVFSTVAATAPSTSVTNTVNPAFVTATVSGLDATGLGIIIPIGYVEMSDTPGIYVKIADGFLLGPNYGGAV